MALINSHIGEKRQKREQRSSIFNNGMKVARLTVETEEDGHKRTVVIQCDDLVLTQERADNRFSVTATGLVESIQEESTSERILRDRLLDESRFYNKLR